MSQETTNVLLLLVPVFIGGIIAAINANQMNVAAESAETRLRGWQQHASARTGWFWRYVLNPLLWSIVKFCDWTDGFVHRGLKNGARVAATLYLVGLWLLLLYAAVTVVIAVVIFVIVLYVAAKVLSSSGGSTEEIYSRPRRVVGVSGKGQRVHPETGVIQEEGFWGWRDTERRVDPETGRFQEEGLIGWRDTDTRIDQNTGVIQKEGMFGFRDTETRINPESGIIQKQGLLGWRDTDERIDPETGKRQKQGLFGWVDE